MSAPPSLSDQVAQAANLLGLMLALVTLFTSEQSRRLSDEMTREGGAHRERVLSIRWACLGLTVVTLSAVLSLGPTALDVVDAIGAPAWQPVLSVFVLTYVLLVALVVWQLLLTKKTFKP